MHYFNTVCPFGHYNNEFMETGTLRHTHVWLHITGIQENKGSSSYHKSKNRISMEKKCGLKKNTEGSNSNKSG